MKALLKNYHQSPQKVRLVANLVRGKSVEAAQAALTFLPKKSGPAIGKLLDSAVANARSAGMETSDLYIKTITVDKGAVMRRFRPFGRGRSGTIRKTMSIIKLELGSKNGAAPMVKNTEKTEKKSEVKLVKPASKVRTIKKTTKSASAKATGATK